MTPRHPPDVDAEALDWLVLLRSGRATPAEHAAYAAWRAQGGRQDRAARDAEALWQDLGTTAGAAAFAAGRRQHGPRPRAGRRSPAPRLVAALAAVLALAILLPAALLPAAVFPAGRLFADISTGSGERRAATLPDGSQVFLDAATALDIRFNPTRRVVGLRAGAAIFSVQPDPGRPFVVQAAGGEARAVGTVFAVRRRDDIVRVLVEEGIVEVRLPGAGSETVAAGAQAVYAPGGGIDARAAPDLAAALAWRRGKLIFNNRPLAEVVRALEPHVGQRVMIAGPRLRDLRVTGVFDLDAPDTILPAIARLLRIETIGLPYLTVLH